MIPTIRDLRKSRGLSLTDLADACQITLADLSQIERGLLEPSSAARARIAQALGVDLFELYKPVPIPKDLEPFDNDVLQVAVLMQGFPAKKRKQLRMLAASLTFDAD